MKTSTVVILGISVAFAAFVGLSSKDHPSNEEVRKSLTGVTTPIETDAIINDGFKDKSDLVNSVVRLVRRNGYRCDSIASLIPAFSAHGFYYMDCNHTAYRYEIEDKGGNWTVTLK